MKSKYKVIYTPEASEDLRSIYYHIAKRLFAPIAARNQVNRIRKEIKNLDIFPSRYAFIECEPWHSIGVHCFPVDNYSILYTINEEQLRVDIVRIFYSGQNIASIGHKQMLKDDNSI